MGLLCKRNILPLNLYCKAGGPENSSVHVAGCGRIPAPKGVRNRHLHLHTQPYLLWTEGFHNSLRKGQTQVLYCCVTILNPRNTSI